MIYLGFSVPEYDESDPEGFLVYSGRSLAAARLAVLAEVFERTHWYDPEPERTVRRSEGWATTSEFASIGSAPALSDEILVAAKPGQWKTYAEGQVWRITRRGTILGCECELINASVADAPVWGWTGWRAIDHHQ